MPSLSRTLAALARHRARWERLFDTVRAVRPARDPQGPPSRLVEVTGFGSNPGRLRMLACVPAELLQPSPLVVVLHGCAQSAASYDLGAGWTVLAERYGFALVFAEQRRLNNPQACFNWFLPADATRDQGEALSIRQMVARMARDHAIDRARVFITGLSAGGAMTSVMLATYPEVFAGGAIIAGLPYGTARNVHEGLESMFEGRPRPAPDWGDLVRAASPYRGPWPKVSIWHGSADTTVVPANAGEIVKQWTDLHGLPATPTHTETVAGHPRAVWRDWRGEVIEAITVDGMGHGSPLDRDAGHGGREGGFFLEAGISSSYVIAKFWGLAGPGHTRFAAPDEAPPIPIAPADELKAALARALRAIGLLR